MRKNRLIMAIAVVVTLSTTTAFAAKSPTNPSGADTNGKSQKIVIMKKLTDGKSITTSGKELQYSITNKNINLKLDKSNLPEGYDKMTPQEKRDWMVTNLTNQINEAVKAGKITQSQADAMAEMLKNKMGNIIKETPSK
jgi:hypothetical protein